MHPMPTDPARSDDQPPDDLVAPDDPILKALVDKALAPYVGRLAPDLLEDMRAQLVITMTTHPNCAPILQRAREEAGTDPSGTRTKRGKAR